MRTPIFLAPALLAVLTPPALAHYNMLLPQSASAKKGEAVTFTYQWGHPFEHQLFDAPQPARVVVLSPDGKKTDLTKTLVKTTVPAAEGKKADAYQFKFTPDQRGDYVFLLRTPEIFMKEDGEFLQDTVKVILHVQAQKGWDAEIEGEFEGFSASPLDPIMPLTRPYGLQPGMVFQGLVHAEMESLSPVEVERYNAIAPKELPPDEHITRTVKIDPRDRRKGVFTTTLPEAGWWCLTAGHVAGIRQREGKKYPLRLRSTLWVYVDEKVTGK
jgi:uncharacterized GH25 family protein